MTRASAVVTAAHRADPRYARTGVYVERIRAQVLAAAPKLEPAFPWRLHAHNPRPAPLVPDGLCEPGNAPVAWSTQCRDCWGFIDDPRHLVPLAPYWR